MLPGSDPQAERPGRALHRPLRSPRHRPDMPGDNIYNGAADNATGCGMLIELARVWSQARSQPPPHSIIFAAVTAEEQGLLGSEYLGKHPPDPRRANLARDSTTTTSRPSATREEVNVNGAERTTFYPARRSHRETLRPRHRPRRPSRRRPLLPLRSLLPRPRRHPAFSIDEGLQYKGHDAAWGKANTKTTPPTTTTTSPTTTTPTGTSPGLAHMTQFGVLLGQKAASAPNLQGWQTRRRIQSRSKEEQLIRRC